MIDGTTGMAGLIITFIVVLLCRYSYWLGLRDGAKKGKIPYHNYPVFYQIEKED